MVWLERYFNMFGDRAPNREETFLMIMAKSEVYNQYRNEMFRIDQKPVDEAIFVSIWNNLFPRYVNRPWCDIPGKCDTCYQIDNMRRQCQNEAKLLMLKKAHHMHRGGLFMLERLE